MVCRFNTCHIRVISEEANEKEIRWMTFSCQHLVFPFHPTWHQCGIFFKFMLSFAHIFWLCVWMGCGVVVHGYVFSRRQVEWEAASSLIEGICLTLQRQPIISFLPHLRSLINVCVNLVWKHTRRHKMFNCHFFFFFWRMGFYLCVLSGDGCSRSFQRGRWASSAPPQPIPLPSAPLQHCSGPAGCTADPGRIL